MTPAELAAQINGREYRDEVSDEIKQIAKENGLVIVYGASDDLVEFDGAAYEEYSAYDGAVIPVGKDGEPIFGCEEPCNQCSAVEDAEKAETKINAQWSKVEGYSWFIDIAGLGGDYGVFNILEDGETYCRGIVFALRDVK